MTYYLGKMSDASVFLLPQMCQGRLGVEQYCHNSPLTTSDYWSLAELQHSIATREALALNKFLSAYGNRLSNAWVDAMVDNRWIIRVVGVCILMQP